MRVLGDFPNRSAFRVVVKQNGKTVGENRCEATVYTKEKDGNVCNDLRKKERDLTYENFMYASGRCKNEAAVIKAAGKMDVEIYVIDGDTDLASDRRIVGCGFFELGRSCGRAVRAPGRNSRLKA